MLSSSTASPPAPPPLTTMTTAAAAVAKFGERIRNKKTHNKRSHFGPSNQTRFGIWSVRSDFTMDGQNLDGRN